MTDCSLNSQCVAELLQPDGSGITEVPVLCSNDPLTLRCGTAHRGGGQRGVQAVDSIIEMLSKENVIFHRLTGQSVQLLPPGKTNFSLVLWTVLCIVITISRTQSIPGVSKAHGKQDHTCLFELSCSLHHVALGLSVRQNNDNLGCVAGVAASW